MLSTLLRFALLLTLLLLGHAAAHAQSAPAPALSQATRTVTGFGDPEPMDPRYAHTAEVDELKAQVRTLVQAYEQLVSRYNEQSSRLQELERKQLAPATATSSTTRNRSFRVSNY